MRDATGSEEDIPGYWYMVIRGDVEKILAGFLKETKQKNLQFLLNKP